MEGAAAAFVAGVEGAEQVDDFWAADLADDQAVGAHPEGLADQVAQADLAGALDVRGSCLEADDVGMVGAQFAGVLDQDQSLGRVDQRQQRVEQVSSCRFRCRR